MFENFVIKCPLNVYGTAPNYSNIEYAVFGRLQCPEVNIALRRFLHIQEISRQREARGRDYALLSYRMTSRVLYSAQYHRQHCALQAFEQFGTMS